MNYQVLARKWRPRDFSTLVGQEHVVKALSHALDQNRLHHAWLFTGTRGVGKTTLSRILAKALNCVGPDGQGGITSQPCGVCQPCKEIDAGRFVDYLEMDAASNRGVEEMASLLEKAIYGPSVGRYKVYMIDEVHMLTNHAFNAMLKTLEEPPEHVKFILATTDPQKIPVTVLSRCLQFNLKQMPAGHIVGHLAYVLGEEKIAYENNALRLLAKAAQGSMRDALSLTDQAIAYSAGSISEEAVRGMLGALDQSYLIRLCDALYAEDGASLISIADEMAERSLSFSTALQDLGGLLHKIALVKSVPAAVQDDWPEADDIKRLAQCFDAQELQLFYQIANQGRYELALAPDEYAGFTMALLRMLAFRPTALGGTNGVGGAGRAGGASIGQALPSTQQSSNSAQSSEVGANKPSAVKTAALSVSPIANLVSPTRHTETSPKVSMATEAATKPTAPTAARTTSSNKGLSPFEAAQRLAERAAARPSAKLAPQAEKTPEITNKALTHKSVEVIADEIPPWMDAEEADANSLSPSVKSITNTESVRERLQEQSTQLRVEEWPKFDGNWPALVSLLGLTGLALELARQAELQQVTLNNEVPTFVLQVPVKQVTEGGALERLQASLLNHFSTRVKVEVMVNTQTGVQRITAAAVDAEVHNEKLQQAEAALLADPIVQTLQRDFGAKIVSGSIRPL